MAAVDITLQHEIEQFLYREARLLDAEDFDAWLEMLCEDIHYWMPAMQNRYRRDKNPPYTENGLSLYDEDMKSLKLRIRRFKTGMAWPEDPPTRHCHVITNIEVELTDDPDVYRVFSAFVNQRSRTEQDDATMIGRREDIVRRVDGVLKLARRKIITTQSTILAKNLSVFL